MSQETLKLVLKAYTTRLIAFWRHYTLKVYTTERLVMKLQSSEKPAEPDRANKQELEPNTKHYKTKYASWRNWIRILLKSNREKMTVGCVETEKTNWNILGDDTEINTKCKALIHKQYNIHQKWNKTKTKMQQIKCSSYHNHKSKIWLSIQTSVIYGEWEGGGWWCNLQYQALTRQVTELWSSRLASIPPMKQCRLHHSQSLSSCLAESGNIELQRITWYCLLLCQWCNINVLQWSGIWKYITCQFNHLFKSFSLYKVPFNSCCCYF